MTHFSTQTFYSVAGWQRVGKRMGKTFPGFHDYWENHFLCIFLNEFPLGSFMPLNFKIVVKALESRYLVLCSVTLWVF